MGYRVSLYRIPKNQEPFVLDEDFGIEVLNGERIIFDTATDAWLTLQSKEEFKKEIKCLKEDVDVDYYSLSKEALRQIIIFFSDKVKAYYEKLSKSEVNVQHFLDTRYRTWSSPLVQGDLISLHVNMSDKDPNLVSGSWDYEYGIFDLVHVLKTFDWDNDILVPRGGR